jgi:hypothetical protein
LGTHASSISPISALGGFDPQSPLPPPNEITTEGLAFLGYDFFGRIVEKAIFLRSIDAERGASREFNKANIILELEEAEQLDTRDVARAMEDQRARSAATFWAGI